MDPTDPATSVLREVAAACTRPVDPRTAEVQLAAIVELARVEAAGPAPRVVRMPWLRARATRLVAAVAAAVLAASGITTGLAMAGVITLPTPARAVLGTFGVHLPSPHVNTPASPRASASPSPSAVASASPRPHPTHQAGPHSDNADPRASRRGDNADPRAAQRGDNANPTPSATAGDHADPRASTQGDNADPRASRPPGDVAP